METKFSTGNPVIVIPLRMGAEVTDPAPSPGMVRVRIAEILLPGGTVRIREADFPEADLEPIAGRQVNKQH